MSLKKYEAHTQITFKHTFLLAHRFTPQNQKKITPKPPIYWDFCLQLHASFIQSIRYFKLYIYFMSSMHFLDILLILRFDWFVISNKNTHTFITFASYHCYMMDFLTTFVKILLCSQNFVMHLFYMTAIAYVWTYTITVVQVCKIFQLLWYPNILLVQKNIFFIKYVLWLLLDCNSVF